MKKFLPNLHDDGFELVSGVESHKEAPKTFWIPSDAEKAQVKKGNIVKLNFSIRTADSEGETILNGERMWVIVADRDGDWFTGILDNQPQCTDEMKPGLVLQFKPEHIININEMTLDLDDEKYQEYRDALKKALAEE